jgi:hypothetical protein
MPLTQEAVVRDRGFGAIGVVEARVSRDCNDLRMRIRIGEGPVGEGGVKPRRGVR